jgi:hypothetical protein
VTDLLGNVFAFVKNLLSGFVRLVEKTTGGPRP